MISQEALELTPRLVGHIVRAMDHYSFIDPLASVARHGLSDRPGGVAEEQMTESDELLRSAVSGRYLREDHELFDAYAWRSPWLSRKRTPSTARSARALA